MKTTKFKNYELLELSKELLGNPRQSLKGMLNEKLPIKTKYWLSRFEKSLKPLIEELETLRVELIKKYGEENPDGSFSVKTFTEEGKQTEEYKTFAEEYNELLILEVEVSHSEFYLKDFEQINSESHYPILLSLLEEETP